MNTAVKKLLLTGSALVAVSMIGAGAAHATEMSNPIHATITASDFTGLQETTGTTTAQINSTTGAAPIFIGQNNTPSVTMNSVNNTLTLNVAAAGTAYGVVFSDNVNAIAGSIVINSSTDNIYFNGDVSSNVAVNMGSPSTNPTLALVVETVNAENIVFAGTINAVDAADTVNLSVYNGNGGANTVTFTGAIGGGTDDTRIDNITIGNDTTNPLDVRFNNSVNAQGNITLGVAGANNNTNTVTFGLTGQTTSYTGTVQGAAAADTNNVIIAGGSTTTFNSGFGNMLDNITIGGSGTTNTTFKGDINAVSGALTLAGGAGVTNNVTFEASGGNVLAVYPTVAATDAAGTHNITIAGGAGQTVQMLGGGTNIDSYTINSGTTLRYQSSSINNVSGTGGNLLWIATMLNPQAILVMRVV